MKRGFDYALAIVFLLALAFLLFGTNAPSLTGYAVLTDYSSQSECENAGYVWEDLTEENCTTEEVCTTETVDCEPCLEYEDINGTQGDCFSYSSCEEEACEDITTCHDVIIGGQCVGEIIEEESNVTETVETNSTEETTNLELETNSTETQENSTLIESTNSTEETGSISSNESEEEEEEEDDEEGEETDETEDEAEEETETTMTTTTQTTTDTLNEEEESESLGELTGESINEEFNASECEGCVFGSKCYDFNKTKSGSYCTTEGWVIQREFNSTCLDDFECASFNCEEGVCGDETAFRRFLNWLKSLFIQEIENMDFNETIVIEEISETNETI